MRTGLYIGRFQPLHKAHYKVINKLAKKVDCLIIGVGSSEKHHTIDNPFTLKERTDMLNDSLKIKNYSIKPIPDLDDYQRWAKHVKKLAGKFDVVYTGNKLVKELLKKEGLEVKLLKPLAYISATQIRDMIAKDQNWEKYVPKQTAKVIKKVGGEERIKNLTKAYKNPVPAVDIIIETNKGVLLIERNHEPYGWAIPGGHVEYGESVETAAVREAKEETSLDVKLVKLLGVYSDPKRDPRKHTISMVYVAKAEGSPKAGSDAKSFKIYTKDNLPENLCFDHKKILEDYFKYKEGGKK